MSTPHPLADLYDVIQTLEDKYGRGMAGLSQNDHNTYTSMLKSFLHDAINTMVYQPLSVLNLPSYLENTTPTIAPELENMCEICGTKSLFAGVEVRIDPYEYTINEKEIEATLCLNCYNQLKQEAG